MYQGQSPPGSSYNEEGKGVPFFQGKAEFGAWSPDVRKWTTEPTRLAQAGDILLSIRAPVGPTNVATQECCIGRGLAALRPTAIEQRYLLWYMRASESNLAAKATGSTFTAISGAQVREHLVPVAPRNEQFRIVEAIENSFTHLDAAVMSLNRVRAKLTQYRAAVLSAASEGRLVERQTDYKEIRLEDIKAFSMYGPRFSSKDYSKTGRYVLRTSDISESGRVCLEEAPMLDLSSEEFARYRVEVGDLLITRTGSLGTLSVFNDTVDAIPGAYLIQYRVNRKVANPWFIFMALKSPKGQAVLKGSGAGVGRPNLNAPSIDAVPLLLPSTLAEQERIVAEAERRLSVADALTAEVDKGLAKCARTRQAILKKAFEGHLVPQDPKDEAASIALQRIAPVAVGRAKRSKTA